MSKGRVASSFKHYKMEYLMTVPSTLLFLAISIYPLFMGIYMSLEYYNLLRPQSRAFVGLQNYIELLTVDKEFHGVILYTFVYTISAVLISFLIGFVLALLIDRKMRGSGIYKTLLLLPWVVAPSVAAVNWLWLTNDQIGFINNFLKQIGLIDESIIFFGRERMAQFSVIATDIWRDYPFMMIVILAGLQSISKDLYEAAYVDGANFWQTLWHIIIPGIKGVCSTSLILMFIWVFNHFDNVYLLTKGGPNDATYTLPIYVYTKSFFRGQLGYSSAMGVYMLIFMLFVALFYMRVTRQKD